MVRIVRNALPKGRLTSLLPPGDLSRPAVEDFRIQHLNLFILQTVPTLNPVTFVPSHLTAPSQFAASGTDPDPLDNPIWHALLTEQSALAIGNGLARRFPAEIGPLCGVPDQSPASYAALRPLAGPGGIVGLFFTEPAAPPSGWIILRAGLIDQMVCLAHRNEESAQPEHEPTPRRLTAADVPAMLELATLTEPGPFEQRTIELGSFFGIFDGERLLAMAGQRLRLPGFTEVSGVCTHPDARGRGYARILMDRVMDEISKRGKTPFLHVLSENSAAISVYQSLGFIARRTLHLGVLRNDG